MTWKKVKLDHKDSDVSTLLPLRKYDCFMLDGIAVKIISIENYQISFDNNTGMSQAQLLTYMRFHPDKYYMTERWYEEKEKEK